MRRSLQWLVAVVLSMAATAVGPVVLAVVLLAAVPAARTAVLDRALARARASIPGDLTLGRASWPSLERIELENVLWLDRADTLARAERIVVHVDLPRLARRDIHLRELAASGLRADLLAVRARFQTAPEETLQEAVEPRGAFPRKGSLPGAPSIGVDRIDIDAPFVRTGEGSTVEDLRLRGSIDLLHGSRATMEIDELRAKLPERESAIEEMAIHLDLEEEGRLEARGSGHLGREWPFRLEAATGEDGRWNLALLKDTPEAAGEGLEAGGTFRRDGRRLVGLTLDARIRTPGTRSLSRFPSIGRAFEGLPDLEGVRGRAQGQLSFERETSGAFFVELDRNEWMSGGFANVAFEPGRVNVDTLSLGFLDLDVAGHWRRSAGAQDGSVVARARGTRWMRPFVEAGSEPDSLAFELRARIEGPSDDLGVTALLTGGVRRGGLRLQNLALAARGSTAPGAGVEFRAAGIASNLDVRLAGDLEHDGALRARLDPVVVLEPDPRAPRPAIALPEPRAQSRSALARTLQRFAPGDHTVSFDTKSKQLRVRSLRIEGDFGRGVVDGEFDPDEGGSFGADLSWPEAPAFVMRRLKAGDAARRDLAARWSGHGERFGATVEARLLRARAGMEARMAGSMRIPGPATLAPLLPPGAAVNDLGPIAGQFTFRTLPQQGGGWSLAAALDPNGWIESFAVRAHNASAVTVLDSLDARLLGVALAASGRLANGALDGRARVQVANGSLLQRLQPASPPTDLRLDLAATVGGATRAPDVAARFEGLIARGGLSVPAFDGELAASGRRLVAARFHAGRGADVSTVHFDSLLAVFSGVESPDGAVNGRVRLEARGEDLTIVQAGEVRQANGWTLTGDTLTIAVFDRDLRARQPYELRFGGGSFSLRDLDLAGSLGSVRGEMTRAGARTDVVVTADLTLPEQPTWVATPAGLWPTKMRARLVQQTGDSVAVAVNAEGLQIGPRKNVRANVVLSAAGEGSLAEVVLQNAEGRFADARGVLPGTLSLLPPRFPTVEGPLRFDLALSGFPLPPHGGNPMTAPGYLDRADVDRAPVIDARASLRGTAGSPAASLLGVVTFPNYDELRDYRVLARVHLTAPGTSAPPIPDPGAADTLAGLAAGAEAVRIPEGGPGLLAALQALKSNAEVVRASVVYPMRFSLRPAGAGPNGEPMELIAESKGLPLGDVQPFVPQAKRLSGRAEFRLTARGAPSNPALDGEARLSDVDVTLRGGTTAVGEGTVQIAGQARAPVIDGDLTVDRGTILIPSKDKNLLPIEGEALLWEGESYVASSELDPNASRDIAERRTGSPTPGRPVTVPGLAQIDTIAAREAAEAETTTARAGPMANAEMDVAVHVPTGVWLKGHGIEALLTGDVTLTQRRGHPALVGTLRAEEGRMDFHGRRMEIERGEIVFYGQEQINPSLDFLMVKTSGDVTINAHITGTLAVPRLELTSQPELSEADMFSYLLFDRPSDELESGQQASLESRVVATAQEFATSQLTARLSEQLDLDILSFQYGDRDSLANSVTFGKYISPRLLVKYQQDVEQGRAFEVVLQYWLKGGFKLETHVRRYEQSGVVLTWSREY